MVTYFARNQPFAASLNITVPVRFEVAGEPPPKLKVAVVGTPPPTIEPLVQAEEEKKNVHLQAWSTVISAVFVPVAFQVMWPKRKWVASASLAVKTAAVTSSNASHKAWKPLKNFFLIGLVSMPFMNDPPNYFFHYFPSNILNASLETVPAETLPTLIICLNACLAWALPFTARVVATVCFSA